MSKRRVAIQYTEESILEALGIDKEHFSLARVYHTDYGTVRLIIEGPTLPEISERQEPYFRDPEFLQRTLDDAKAKDRVLYDSFLSSETWMECRVHKVPYPKGAKCPVCEGEQ